MSTAATLIINGSATLNDVDGIAHYGDISRIYTVGGILVNGQAAVNDTDSIVHYGDLKRVYTSGGMSVTGAAELNSQGDSAHFGDIRRVYYPGGQIISGQSTLNEIDNIAHFGDLMKICFVTLTDMEDTFPMILNVTIPAQAIAWMQDEVMTTAWCCKITRKDGVVMAFTSYDCDIVYENVTYKAKTGFDPTAVSTSNDMSTDNLDNSGMISDDSITAQDIRIGKYRDAEIVVFLINYEDTTQPIFVLRRGQIGEITYGKNGYTAEIRGLMEAFSKKIGKVTSKTCRAKFGTSLCKMNTAAYTFTGTVTGVDSDGGFTIDVIKDEDYFSYGLITFTSGANSGGQIEVKKYKANGKTNLFMPLPYPIGLGDTFTITAGCDGNPSTCKKRFNNLSNFRGEFYTPGNNFVSTYPSSESGNIVSENESPRRAVYDWGD